LELSSQDGVGPAARIVLVDYHGVLTDLNPECLSSPPHVRFLRHDALVALKQLAGYHLFIISNQAGVAFGDYQECELGAAIEMFIADLGRMGVTITKFFYCPHHPEAKVFAYKSPCRCRKPSPYYVHQAIRTVSTGRTRCMLVGDNLTTDIECARAAGVKSVWINNNCSPVLMGGIVPDVICSTLLEAIPLINQYLINGTVLSNSSQ
jgi:histidinol-phosphate phosphatase family protein